jgi:predicted enzyme related to lactoylglutathione lyase
VSSTSVPIGWVREVVLDSPDPERLARFWSGLLGGEPVEWYDGWITLEPPPHGQRLSFQKSSSAAAGRGVHFDVLVADLEASHERVVAAGGHYVGERWSPRPAEDGTSVRWRVYEDPDGHPFCLVVR